MSWHCSAVFVSPQPVSCSCLMWVALRVQSAAVLLLPWPRAVCHRPKAVLVCLRCTCQGCCGSAIVMVLCCPSLAKAALVCLQRTCQGWQLHELEASTGVHHCIAWFACTGGLLQHAAGVYITGLSLSSLSPLSSSLSGSGWVGVVSRVSCLLLWVGCLRGAQLPFGSGCVAAVGPFLRTVIRSARCFSSLTLSGYVCAAV